jgi:hypothetical protein
MFMYTAPHVVQSYYIDKYWFMWNTLCVYALKLVATTQVVTHFKHSYDHLYIDIIMLSYLGIG